MKITFCGAAETVTGSCHYVEVDGLRLLLDCGFFQGGRQREDLNRQPFPFDPKSIDGLFVGTETEVYAAKSVSNIFAEIQLIKAEACIELDRFNEANDLISETMLRAGAPFVEQTDKELLREMLLNERGREFLFEGRRWFDMLRAAKRNQFENKQLIIDMILSGADIKQQAILRTRVYDTLSYYLPVQERELIYNQNLVQNPFYDR